MNQDSAFDMIYRFNRQFPQCPLDVVDQLTHEHGPVAALEGDLGVGGGDDGSRQGHDSLQLDNPGRGIILGVDYCPAGCILSGGGRAESRKETAAAQDK